MVYLKILGSAVGSQPSVLISFEKHKYIFNVGEGLQRFCVSNKVKLAKLRHVFFTQLAYTHFGGFPGLALTLSDLDISNISVHGSQGLSNIVGAMSPFIQRPHTHIKVNEATDTKNDSFYVDEYLRVSAYHLQADIHSHNDEDITHTQCHPGEPLFKKPKLTNSKQETHHPVLAFVGRLADSRGKFLVEKAREFGVKPGPKFKHLTDGQNVLDDAGKNWVFPHQVLGPSRNGAIFAIIECPSLLYLPSLIRANIHTLSVDCAVHKCPNDVAQHPDYTAFLHTFNSHTHHILANSASINSNPTALMMKSAITQLQQHTLHSRLFPYIRHSSPPSLNIESQQFNTSPPSSSPSSSSPSSSSPSSPSSSSSSIIKKSSPLVVLHRVRALHCYTFPPHKLAGVSDDGMIQGFDEEAVVCDALQKLDAAGFKPCHPKKNTSVNSDDSTKSMPTIHFLGTGAAIPSQYRSSSGIGILISSSTQVPPVPSSVSLESSHPPWLLLDCGEGTLGQLARLHGASELSSVLAQLQLIWISHKHADHQLGVIGVALARARIACVSPLYIIAPATVINYIESFIQHGHHQGLHVALIDIEETQFDACDKDELSSIAHKFNVFARSSLDITLRSVPVHHCFGAFGVVVTHRDFKLVYSGDTRPCDALVVAGMNADVLIHEATFDDELHEEAVVKRHCTTSEALIVGKRMCAGRTLLTHFSQRYPKIAKLESGACVAFDLLTLPFDQFEELEKLLPALHILLADDNDTDENERSSVSEQQCRKTLTQNSEISKTSPSIKS